MEQGNKDEQIGFHKGSLSTLAKEREELGKMVSVVEQIMQMHMKALKELGIDLEAMANQQKQQAAPSQPQENKSVEDMLR